MKKISITIPETEMINVNLILIIFFEFVFKIGFTKKIADPFFPKAERGGIKIRLQFKEVDRQEFGLDL